MKLENQKYEMLQRAGFVKHFQRDLFLNRAATKIISLVAVEDHDIDWLQQVIEENNQTGRWQFYFNAPVENNTRKEILAELGERG